MKQIRKANWFLLFAISFFIGGSFGIAWLAKHVELPYNLIVMSGQILLGLSLLFFFLVTKTNPLKIIQHKRLGIIDILLVVLLMFLVMPLVYFINYVSMFFTENTTASTIGGMIDNPYWLNLVMLAVTPAVIEEMICRGILFHAYKRKSFFGAVLLTAFIFGLFHMNLNQMLYAGVIGIVFAVTVEVTGSIYSSMLMHFIMNSISVTMLALLKLMKHIGLYSDEMFEMQQAQTVNPMIVSPVITIIMLAAAFMVVIGMTALAVGVIILLAKRNGRVDNLKSLFKKKDRDMLEPSDEPDKGFKSLIIDIPFVIAVLEAFAVMIFL